MRTELLRFSSAVERDPGIDAWMKEHAGGLGAIAHQSFEVRRKCGDEVGSFCMTAVRIVGGRDRDRTGDPLLAKQGESKLSHCFGCAYTFCEPLRLLQMLQN